MSSGSDRAALTLLLACSVLVGCDRGPSEFRCRGAGQCTLGGVAGACEGDGHCSFPDTACPDGRRYGRHAPAALAGRCVEQPRCGDGRIGPGEECDDGNTADDDGCTSRCVRCGPDLGAARFGWTQTGACYVRHDERATWDEAEKACAREGGHLAAFASIYEESAVNRTLLGDAREPHWIGYVYRGLRKEFAWVTNEPRLVARWAVGQPPEQGTQQTCVTVSPVPGPDGVTASAWVDGDCKDRHPYVCERPPAAVRPGDRHVYRGIYLPLRWDDARAACAAIGAHLAAIGSDDEQAFVTGSFYGPIWLGATDIQVEGDFRWVTGEPFAYQRFAPGEPDDYGGIHDCMLMAEDRLWHDRPCGERNPAVCEQE